MKEILKLLKLADTSSKKDKLILLKQLRSFEFFKEFMDLTYLGKKSTVAWKIIEKWDIDEKIELTQSDFLKDLEFLKKSPNRKALFEKYSFKTLSPELQDLLVRFAKRKLVSGISTAEVLEAFYNITPYEVALCQPLTESNTPNGDYILEPKIDGYRGTLIIDTARSRKNEIYNNCDLILEELKPFLNDWIFDGELFAGNWNLTNSITSTQAKHDERDKLKFIIFDMVPKDEWDKKIFSMPLYERKKQLETLFKNNVFKQCSLNPYKRVNITSKQQLDDFMNECIKNGHEGGVAKKAKDSYFLGKKPSWVKLKLFENIDLPISGFVEGSGKFNGTLGGVKVMYNNTETEISGFTDQQRDLIWKNKSSYLGKIVEVKYKEIQPNNVLKTASFVRFRDDK